MDIDCKLSHAEMREAFSMNQTWRFWMQTIRHNLFPAVLTIAIVMGVATNLAKQKSRLAGREVSRLRSGP